MRCSVFHHPVCLFVIGNPPSLIGSSLSRTTFPSWSTHPIFIVLSLVTTARRKRTEEGHLLCYTIPITQSLSMTCPLRQTVGETQGWHIKDEGHDPSPVVKRTQDTTRRQLSTAPRVYKRRPPERWSKKESEGRSFQTGTFTTHKSSPDESTVPSFILSLSLSPLASISFSSFSVILSYNSRTQFPRLDPSLRLKR